MNDHFRISVGVEAMAICLESPSQLGKVVDLSIQYNPDGAIFVMDRLAARRQVDDAQSAHTQPNAPADVNAFIIRSAVHNGLAHVMNRCSVCHIGVFIADNACYAAHGCKVRRYLGQFLLERFAGGTRKTHALRIGKGRSVAHRSFPWTATVAVVAPIILLVHLFPFIGDEAEQVQMFCF